MKKIPLIEGLRGYLALWVVFDHLLAMSGYGLSGLNYFFKIIRSGWYAVDIFIIISGFVIFYLLDSKKENYKTFIIRRFFRLWPLFIVLFFVAIPVSSLIIQNTVVFSELYEGTLIGDGKVQERVVSWRDNMLWHIVAHLPMVHGVLPNSILPFSSGAFLGPAWSISLEWQFYVIAPLVFSIVGKFKNYGVVIISVLFIMLSLIGLEENNYQFGAFLPMHAEFFLIGILSFFSLKFILQKKYCEGISIFPVVLFLTVIFYSLIDFRLCFLPCFIWLVFFSLIIDSITGNKKIIIKISYGLFESRLIKYLGRISYSIYLSHIIVIYITQHYLLKHFSNVSQKNHLLILSLTVICFTILFSGLLYKYVEKPFMEFGNNYIRKSD